MDVSSNERPAPAPTGPGPLGGGPHQSQRQVGGGEGRLSFTPTFLSYHVHKSGLVIPKTVSMVGEAAFQFFKN